MPRFATMRELPEMSGRRYGLLELGTQKVELLRAEHLTLVSACAALLGVPADDLTTEAVAALATRRLEPLP